MCNIFLNRTCVSVLTDIFRTRSDQRLTCMAISIKSIKVPIPQNPTVQNFSSPKAQEDNSQSYISAFGRQKQKHFNKSCPNIPFTQLSSNQLSRRTTRLAWFHDLWFVFICDFVMDSRLLPHPQPNCWDGPLLPLKLALAVEM